MLDIQTIIISRTILVIGIFYTTMLLAPFLFRKVSKLFTKKKSKTNDKDYLKKPKNIIKESAISTAVYLLVFVLSILIIFTGLFLYCTFTTDDDPFAMAKALMNQNFWMNGIMVFAYTPLVISVVVVFLVIAFYSLFIDDFKNNIAFVDIDNGFLSKKRKKDLTLSSIEDIEYDDMISERTTKKKNAITQLDWFRKNYIILLFIASLFIYTIIFVPIWGIEKMAYVKTIVIILMILICSLASFKKWWVMFITYAVILGGFFITKQ
jgi:hypothetical protein